MKDLENDGYKYISILLIVIISVCFFVLGLIIGLYTNKKIVRYEFDISKDYCFIPERYEFMNPDMSKYICNLSDQLGIDSDLVVAILLQENPSFNPFAVNRNPNGTTDIGLFQLNDKYLYTDFLKKYWKITEIEFDAYNWKHNAFVAINHIYNLKLKLKIDDDVIKAYNCGINATMRNRIPESTVEYLAAVKNNLQLLKGN